MSKTLKTALGIVMIWIPLCFIIAALCTVVKDEHGEYVNPYSFYYWLPKIAMYSAGMILAGLFLYFYIRTIIRLLT
jgi:hypothetical protein